MVVTMDLRFGLRLLSLIAIGITVTLCAGGTPGVQQNSSDVIARMEDRANRQRAELCEYSVARDYTLENKHLKPNAQMKVHLTYRQGEGKHFQILSIQATGVARRSLQDLLREESEPHRDRQTRNDVDNSNYEFKLLGEEQCSSGRCYKLELKPRRRTKYLVDGTVWIATTDYAIVRISGRLAKSPSFWLQRPEIEQRFEKIDKFWLPSYNHSTTHVLFFGDADLTIEYSGYRVRACAHSNNGSHGR